MQRLSSALRSPRRGLIVRASAATATPSVMAPAMNSEAKARAKAAVLGALVADAATMPLHWIYDVPKMNDLLQGSTSPEFFPTPSCPFYQAEFGQQSPYGAELVPLLKTLADNGDLNPEKFSQAIVDYFTSTTAYRNASIRGVIANHEAGKKGIECGHDKDFQANCFAKASLLVAKYGGSPQLLAKAEAAIRVQQNNDDAVKYGLAGVRILEKVVVDGMSIDAALQWAVSEGGVPADLQALVNRAVAAKATPIKDLQYDVPEYMKEMVDKHVAIKDKLPSFTWSVWANGPACGNPAAFTNVMMAVGIHSGFVEGVRANLMAGGDNCSRACLIGALLAAQGGMDTIPKEWREKTAGFAEYDALVDKLLA